MYHEFIVFHVEGKYWLMDVRRSVGDKFGRTTVVLQSWEYFEDDVEVLLNLKPGEDRTLVWNNLTGDNREYKGDADMLEVIIERPSV